MFIVADNFKVEFQHLVVPDDAVECHRISHITICTISVNGEIISQAEALCSKEDSFSRAIGRKLSLTRVLKVADFNKTVRTMFWKKYWSMVKK